MLNILCQTTLDVAAASRGGNVNFGKSFPPFFLMSVFALAVIPNVLGQSIQEETWTVYYDGEEHGGLMVEVEAPHYVYPGEKMNLTIKVRTIIEQIHVSHMSLNISGLANERNETLIGSIRLFDLPLNEIFTYEITVPDDISPGITLGSISYEWTLWGIPAEVPTTAFMATYVRNREYEELSNDYHELNLTYLSLQENYTKSELQISEELAGTRNMMYVLIVVALVSVASLFFLIRRPKNWW